MGGSFLSFRHADFDHPVARAVKLGPVAACVFVLAPVATSNPALPVSSRRTTMSIPVTTDRDETEVSVFSNWLNEP
jgi:hypothetical protein